MSPDESLRADDLRVRAANDAAVRTDGNYVLYWMTANRRPAWNFALDRAVAHARALDRPLVVLEALRAGYRWASDRLHRFVIEGMRDNEAAFEDSPVLYHPYVEPEPGAGSGLVEELASDACVVVTDDYPAFFLPRMLAAVAPRLPVRCEAVDANGILPMAAADDVFLRAYDFRRFLQRELRPHLSRWPSKNPLRGDLPARHRMPAGIVGRWPRADLDALLASDGLSALPIDHDVPPAPVPGGVQEGRRVLKRFVAERLDGYDDRNQPEADAASGLSPHLHFGHVSAHEVLHAVARHENWAPDKVADSKSGKRSGWWNMSEPAESFLDELVTWRELGFNMCSRRDDHDRYESLPDWARTTLEEHASDPRPHVYDLDTFEKAQTHDELWNAAQNQLRIEGRIHNYLRMLWGKKILHWSESPRAALEVMIELNNKYALDGRDPNSYSGIFWVLGRYDRAWGPERDVFGKIRYMSSANTRRKLRVDGYIERWDEWQPTFSFDA